MSKLLFDENPIVVDRTLAKLIGLNEAIVLQQVHYWLARHSKNQTNYFNGRYWVYNSIKDWHEQNFDFWSYDTVKRTFQKLERMGILISGNFNEDRRDQTKWYTIDYDKLNSMYEEYKKGNAQCIGAKCTNGKGQNAPMQEGKMHQPLPEITTENTTEININNNSLGSDNSAAQCLETRPSDGVVVSLKSLYFEITGRNKGRLIERLASKYGCEKVQKAIEYLREQLKKNDIVRPEGFLVRLLEEDWDLSTFDKNRYMEEKRRKREEEQRKRLEELMSIRASPETAQKYLRMIKQKLRGDDVESENDIFLECERGHGHDNASNSLCLDAEEAQNRGSLG